MTGAEMERKTRRPRRHPLHFRRRISRRARAGFPTHGCVHGDDERFAYKRAQSRLWEMCSERWWARQEDDWHRPLPSEVRKWERKAIVDDTAAEIREPVGASELDIAMGPAVEDSSRHPKSFKTFDKGFEHLRTVAVVVPMQAGRPQRVSQGKILDRE
ncbi:hypothetical protein MRB53_038154 [Persea americana]|nr:hypothetical protein MRB53_038154 [Persea americana]